MRILIRSDGAAIAATLENTAPARDFAALLPLALELRDYKSTERIADLPRRLSTEGAAEGVDPAPGDLAYYAPWGNLAIFHRDFGYARGLVRLGRVDAPADLPRLAGLAAVTIDRRAAAARAWTAAEIARIAAADDLHVSPFREDGRSFGTPTWIWSVVVEGGLYARAYNGTASRWYQAAMREGAGRVSIAGTSPEVVFEPAEATLGERIDAAYRAKYAGSRYLAPMVGERARAATVRIRPRADRP